MAVIDCDVLVIGAGAAGLFAAFSAGQRGRGGMLNDGQGNDTVDDSRGGNAAAVCVSVTGCRLGPEVVARCACGLCHLGC